MRNKRNIAYIFFSTVFLILLSIFASIPLERHYRGKAQKSLVDLFPRHISQGKGIAFIDFVDFDSTGTCVSIHEHRFDKPDVNNVKFFGNKGNYCSGTYLSDMPGIHSFTLVGGTYVVEKIEYPVCYDTHATYNDGDFEQALTDGLKAAYNAVGYKYSFYSTGKRLSVSDLSDSITNRYFTLGKAEPAQKITLEVDEFGFSDSVNIDSTCVFFATKILGIYKIVYNKKHHRREESRRMEL